MARLTNKQIENYREQLTDLFTAAYHELRDREVTVRWRGRKQTGKLESLFMKQARREYFRRPGTTDATMKLQALVAAVKGAINAYYAGVDYAYVNNGLDSIMTPGDIYPTVEQQLAALQAVERDLHYHINEKVRKIAIDLANASSLPAANLWASVAGNRYKLANDIAYTKSLPSEIKQSLAGLHDQFVAAGIASPFSPALVAAPSPGSTLAAAEPSIKIA
jgi:hypothetical protein